jgi:Restriction endonuclease
MPADTPAEQQLTKLNQEIEQLEAESARLEGERGVLAKEASRTVRRFRYLGLARSVRRPTASFEMWPIAALVLGPIITGVLLFVIVNLITGSFGLAFLGFLIGATAGLALVASLLYRPADAILPAAIAEADSQRRVSQVRLEETTERLAAAKDQLKTLLEDRRALMASRKVQLAALLQREWKSMPEAEWEDFVVEVCRTLGATVDRTRRTTDADANLIAEFGNRRIAVVTQAEEHIVNSSAVQHALAGKERHHCASSAIILNRRFTGAAQDYAQRNGCTLVGIEQFPDFVLGKIEV